MQPRGKTEETGHAHALPGHQCVRVFLEILVTLAGGLLLLASVWPPLTADHYAAAVTGLLCSGCFLHLRYRRQKRQPDSPSQSTTLAMLVACLLVAGLFEPPAMHHGDLLLLPALMATLRHMVLPLAVFTYWMVFCGPVKIRRRSLLSMLPALPLMYASLSGPLARHLPQLPLPLHLADARGWAQGTIHALMAFGVFVITVLLLKIGKDYLIDTARHSPAFRA